MEKDVLHINQIHTLLGIPSKEIEARVNAKLDECVDKLRTAGFPRIGTGKPKVEYDLKGHTAGQAIGAGIIRLNLDILNDPRYQEDMINDTVPHEFAHNVVSFMWPSESAHGLAWQSVCRVLGIEPSRCHNYETKAARKRNKTTYHYDCGCPTGHEVSVTLHNRIQRGKVYRCQKCGHTLK